MHICDHIEWNEIIAPKIFNLQFTQHGLQRTIYSYFRHASIESKMIGFKWRCLTTHIVYINSWLTSDTYTLIWIDWYSFFENLYIKSLQIYMIPKITNRKKKTYFGSLHLLCAENASNACEILTLFHYYVSFSLTSN